MTNSSKVTIPQMKISASLKYLAETIDVVLEEIAGQRVGFSLLVFNEETNSRTNYISNTDRKHVIGAIKELLTRWDEGLEDVPLHDEIKNKGSTH